MKSSFSDKIRIAHALSSIADIDSMLDGVCEDEFYSNTEKKLAVLKSIEIISEALSTVSVQTISLSIRPIPLHQIKGFRNLVVHEYFRVDYAQVYMNIKAEFTRFKDRFVNDIRKAREFIKLYS